MSGVETWWEHHLESINKVEDIASAILNSPEQTELFHKFIEQKYGLESTQKIHNVTKNELKDLRSELWEANQQENFAALWKFVYEEVIEDQINKDIEKATSIENIVDGFDSNRLTDMQKLFESYTDQKFWNYDFLSWTQLNLLKLSIVDNFASSSFLELAMNSWGDFKWEIQEAFWLLQEWEYSDALSQAKNGFSNFKESGDSLKRTLDNFLFPYELKLSEIDAYIKEKAPNLSIEEKKNIFSNIELFNNPKMLSEGVTSFDVTSIDFSNIQLNKNGIDTDILKEFMVNSKEKIWNLASKLNEWDAAQNALLGLMDNELTGSVVKELLGFALKLPIVWKMLAVFLWIDPENPSESLDWLTLQYSTHKTLLDLWKTETKSGEAIKWEWVFENIDLWKQDFQTNKENINKILDLTWLQDKSELKQFWLDSFSKKWVEINGVLLKFEWLHDKDNFENGILKENYLSKILKQWLNKYEVQKEKLLIEKERQKIAEEEQKIQLSITQSSTELVNKGQEIVDLSQDIENISFLKNKENMQKIAEWDDWFNIWDVSDIKISEIITAESIEELLKKSIWEEVSQIEEYHLLQLSLLQKYLQEYSKEHSLWNDISTLNDLYEWRSVESKEFFQYLDWEIKNKESLIAEIKSDQSEIVRKLETLNVWVSPDILLKQDLLDLASWDLSEWMVYNKNWDVVKFDKDLQELQLWNNTFVISNSGWFNFDKINIIEWWIEFTVAGRDILVWKMKVIDFLISAQNSEEQIETLVIWDKSVTLERKA